MKFPTVTGTNLLRRKFAFPTDLQADLNLLLVAFYQWHQPIVNSWIPLAESLEATYNFRYFELPVIQPMNVLNRTMINEGMRLGIPDWTARERTVTLYLDKSAFRRALKLPNEDTVYAFLVNRLGEIKWRSQGNFNPDKGEILVEVVEEILGREKDPQERFAQAPV